MSDLRKLLLDTQKTFGLAEEFRSHPKQILKSYNLSPIEEEAVIDGGENLLRLLHTSGQSDLHPLSGPTDLHQYPPPSQGNVHVPTLNPTVKVWPIGGKGGKGFVPSADLPSTSDSILNVKATSGSERYQHLVKLMEGLSDELLNK